MIKFFSLFAGIGGLEYGLNQSKNNECVGFSELKESSIRIYKQNNLDCENYGDIKNIDYEKLPDFDLLLGGFPCQSFSMAGLRKGFKDKRGKMIFHICELIDQKQPKFVILENVKGLLNHNKGQTYIDVFKLLTYLGYYVRVVLLNSLHYGSAQSRERLFFLCSKEDFDRKVPVIENSKSVFLYIKDPNIMDYKYIKMTDKNIRKVEQKAVRNFELIGDYDRVGTLTTQIGCGEKVAYYNGSYRYLTVLECERLQGFPDGWTKGESEANRYWALGNAVNCNVSDYLMNKYLKDLWW